MQHLKIINDFVTLLHKHGPDADEVKSYMKQYDHFEDFLGRARTLQAVLREQKKVNQALS